MLTNKQPVTSQVMNGNCLQVLVVGGGAGGVELALSLHHYLQQPRQDSKGSTTEALPAHVT